LVRFFADHRIKPHVPPFEQIPANFVKFRSCDYTTQVGYLHVSLDPKTYRGFRPSTHLLQYRLIGLLILFEHYTYMPQRQFFIASRFRRWRSP